MAKGKPKKEKGKVVPFKQKFELMQKAIFRILITLQTP